jgi:protein O-mannosyl-transferase
LPRRLLLLVLTALAFAGALAVPFYLDDFALLTDPIVTSPDGWYRSWGLLQTRPLTWFTFWLNYQIGGEAPVGYHAVNIALHLLSVWLLWGTLPRLRLPEPAALTATVLFALHPIQTEPVVYVFARATLLMALFCILSLRAWVRGREWQAVAWFALALLSKEECVTFPLFLLLLHLAGFLPERRPWASIGAMLLLSLSAGLRGIYVTSVIAGSGAGTQAGVSPIDYLPAQGLAIWHYVRLLVIPIGFSLESPIELARWGVVGWLPLLAIAIWALRRPDLRNPALWFTGGLVLLLASSSLFPTADLSAERRVYLPLVGWGVAAGLLLARWHQVTWPLALLLAALTGLQTLAWRDPAAFWRHASEQAPQRVRPLLQYARQLSPNEASAVLNRAQSLAPDDPQVASEQGRVWLERGDAARALEAFGRALALEPGNARAVNNRAVALQRLGQRDAAVADFRRALAIDPCLFDARLNLQRLGEPVPPVVDCHYTPRQRTLLEGK